MNPPYDASVEAAWEALRDLCARYMPPDDLEMVGRAFTVAAIAHGNGKPRESGEAYILHPIAVAATVAQLALDAHGVSAALLHDTVEDTDITSDDIARDFGTVVRDIVEGVTKFVEPKLDPQNSGPHPQPQVVALDARAERKKRERSATIRKLLLAMQDDPRVVLVKIADRLHNLRTLASMNGVQRERTSRETIEVYAPLADRIGLYNIKNEMEDLAFSYLEPEAFTAITARLAAETETRQEWAQRVCRCLESELKRNGLLATVNWRAKHPYRAYVETKDHGIDVSHLIDLIAFRVLLPAQDDCYRAVGVIHNYWRPSRYEDFIASPKSNGYQSFHTSVFGLEGHSAKLHIRTHEMHRAVQHGIAEFWLERASRGEHVDGGSPAEMRKLRALVGWVAQIATLDEDLGADPVEFLDALKGDLLRDQVYIHTPKGDTIELPLGATVLDAAYKIHTSIGDHTTGATIQSSDYYGNLRRRTVGPDYMVHRGDVVRIHTARDVHPEPSWLEIAHSHYAKNKINRALRLQQRQREITSPPVLPDGFTPRPLVHPTGKVARARLGRCCYPCPGDPLLGLAHPGNEVTLHRACCRFLQSTLARRRAEGAIYPDPIPVTWPEIVVESFSAPLLISGQDHQGLMHEITVCSWQLGLNVSTSNASANSARYRAAIAITLDIPSNIRLDYVIGRLRRVPGVLSVWRDTGKGCFENPS